MLHFMKTFFLITMIHPPHPTIRSNSLLLLTLLTSHLPLPLNPTYLTSLQMISSLSPQFRNNIPIYLHQWFLIFTDVLLETPLLSYLQEYVGNNFPSSTHPISHYITHNHLSNNNSSFVMSLHNQTKPKPKPMLRQANMIGNK